MKSCLEGPRGIKGATCIIHGFDMCTTFLNVVPLEIVFLGVRQCLYYNLIITINVQR